MSQIIELIKSRRSTRQFQPKDIPEELIKQLLEAACRAPSAGNLQPWKFYVVRDNKLRKGLAAASKQKFVSQAPVVIVVCALPEQSAAHYGERGRNLYCLQDTAAAVQNILLAASSLKLGTCWVGAFSEEEVRSLLNLNREERPVAMIPVGYPIATAQTLSTGRIPLENISRWL